MHILVICNLHNKKKRQIKLESKIKYLFDKNNKNLNIQPFESFNIKAHGE